MGYCGAVEVFRCGSCGSVCEGWGGAVATQSYANTAYGPEALQLFSEGKSAEEVIEIITSRDEDKDLRQVGVIDANGNAATFIGEKCYDWAGGIVGEHFAAQGNILVDEKTVQEMAKTFQDTSGTLACRVECRARGWR